MIRLRRQSKPIFLQNKTGKSDAKSVWIGGDHPIVVQSMTTTDTADADKTLEQIYGLTMEGCEVVRVTVKDPPDAAGLPAIVHRSPVPIVADIHFDHKMALAAIEAGVAKLRLNPGNIRDPKKVSEVVTAAKARGIPIRVGVNMGSLAPDLEKTLGHTAEAMVESALRHVEMLEEHGHTDIAISLKAHDVLTTVAAYRLMDKRLRERDNALRAASRHHRGGIAARRHDQVVDRSRHSAVRRHRRYDCAFRSRHDPVEEVPVCWDILKSLGLREKGFEITACPSCGRAEISVLELGRAVEAIAKSYNAPVKVAVMGCVVNGPGESKMADVGVAGGKGKGAIYRAGELVGTYPESELLGMLRLEIEKVIVEKYPEYVHEIGAQT